MICGKKLDTVKPSGKYQCSLCRKRVQRNSIFFISCDAWIHQCSVIKGRLVDIPDLKCNRCLGLALHIDGRPVENVSFRYQKLEVVESFVYLGDEIFPNRGCEVSTIARISSTWGKFQELLPLLTYQAIPFKSRGKVYNSNIRSVLLYGSECWVLTTADVERPHQNEHTMICWIYKVKTSDKISSDSLLNKLGLKDLDKTLQTIYTGLVMFVVAKVG